MDMLAILQSPVGVTLLVIVGLPLAQRAIASARARLGQRRRQEDARKTGGRLGEARPAPPPPERRAVRNVRLLLLFAMLGFSLGQALFFSPIDPFSQLGLSVTVPASTLRAAMTEHHRGRLPLHAQRTLGLLSTLDNRLAYLRYGPDSAFNPLCSSVKGAPFRFWVAMIRRLGSYALAATVIGVLTEFGGRHRRRKPLGLLLMAMWAGEGYALYTGRWDREAKVRLSRSGRASVGWTWTLRLAMSMT